MPELPMVTVIVPCRNERDYIGSCLESIAATTYPKDRLEVLVVDGQSDDGTRATLTGYLAAYPWMRVVENRKRITPAALNLGVRIARGDIIVRMDAHASYPPEYIPGLVTALEETGADNVGGRMITVPGAPGPVARSIALALAHPFGVGNALFRIGVRTRCWTDTVQFGCYRREVFGRIGLFDEELVRNQDDEFNFRLSRNGGRILLTPDVELRYFGRASFRQLARMYYQYGRFKPLVALKIGRIMTLRQLVPAALLLCLGLGGVLALVSPTAAVVWGALVLLYLAATVVSAVHGARKTGLWCTVALGMAFPCMHLSYGYGFLRGAWDLLFRDSRGGLQTAADRLSR